ncbi:hypothetical protein TRVL_06548 [Trypanosoma vivax]|nr:hypothetical protein TRVL_06548 [Trypanosoma vivax]
MARCALAAYEFWRYCAFLTASQSLPCALRATMALVLDSCCSGCFRRMSYHSHAHTVHLLTRQRHLSALPSSVVSSSLCRFGCSFTIGTATGRLCAICPASRPRRSQTLPHT